MGWLSGLCLGIALGSAVGAFLGWKAFEWNANHRLSLLSEMEDEIDRLKLGDSRWEELTKMHERAERAEKHFQRLEEALEDCALQAEDGTDVITKLDYISKRARHVLTKDE